VVGLPIVLPVNTAPYQVMVQFGGEAFRLRAIFSALNSGATQPFKKQCSNTCTDNSG
jgi:hypothetical protein